MRTSISEKDKKLLIKLVIGLALFGVIYLVIMPLYNQNTDLNQKIRAEENKRQQAEMKVRTLSSMQVITQEDEKTLLDAGKMFYPVMTDTEIDYRVTSQVMEYGLIARDLSISTPARGDYASLSPYVMVEKSVEEEEETEFSGGPYTGLYTARVALAVIGERSDLQRFLDANINAGVKQRVVSYLWNTQRDGQYGLSMTVELYMCEEIEEFLKPETESETQE